MIKHFNKLLSFVLSVALVFGMMPAMGGFSFADAAAPTAKATGEVLGYAGADKLAKFLVNVKLTGDTFKAHVFEQKSGWLKDDTVLSNTNVNYKVYAEAGKNDAFIVFEKGTSDLEVLRKEIIIQIPASATNYGKAIELGKINLEIKEPTGAKGIILDTDTLDFGSVEEGYEVGTDVPEKEFRITNTSNIDTGKLVIEIDKKGQEYFQLKPGSNANVDNIEKLKDDNREIVPKEGLKANTDGTPKTYKATVTVKGASGNDIPAQTINVSFTVTERIDAVVTAGDEVISKKVNEDVNHMITVELRHDMIFDAVNTTDKKDVKSWFPQFKDNDKFKAEVTSIDSTNDKVEITIKGKSDSSIKLSPLNIVIPKEQLNTRASKNPENDIKVKASKLALNITKSSEGSSGGGSGRKGGGGGSAVTPSKPDDKKKDDSKPAVTVKNEAAKELVKNITDQKQADAVDKLVEKAPVTAKKEAIKALTADTKAKLAQAVLHKYTDVKTNEWYSNDLAVVATLGLVKGTSTKTISPFKNVTGQEMMAMLVRSMGKEVNQSQDANWYDAYKVEAKALKLDEGIKFDLAKDLTRAEVAAMMFRYVKLNEKNPTAIDVNVLAQVKDMMDIPAEYKEAVAYMYQKGLLKGYEDGSFMPNKNVSRIEVAVILARLLAM